jgi:hypothetical protein
MEDNKSQILRNNVISKTVRPEKKTGFCYFLFCDGVARICLCEMRPKIDTFTILCDTVECHLSGLIGTANHPVMQKIRIVTFFFKYRLYWQPEVEKKILGYIFIYVVST